MPLPGLAGTTGATVYEYRIIDDIYAPMLSTLADELESLSGEGWLLVTVFAFTTEAGQHTRYIFRREKQYP